MEQYKDKSLKEDIVASPNIFTTSAVTLPLITQPIPGKKLKPISV